MKRGDAYNYMFELHVNVLRSKRISEREKDKVRDKLSKFDKMYREAAGAEPLGGFNTEGVRRTTGNLKSQKHVDDYVVSLVREFEDMLKLRWSESGVF